MSSGERVIEKAVQVLERFPNGLLHNDLVAKVSAELPDVPFSTVKRRIRFRLLPPTVYRPSYGLYRLDKFREQGEQGHAPSTKQAGQEKTHRCSVSVTQEKKYISSKKRVIEKAFQVLERFPNGLLHNDLVAKVSAELPDIPFGTVKRRIHITLLEPTVYQPNRGLYRLDRFREQGEQGQAQATKQAKREKIREEDFYKAFGDWLIDELEECTKSVSIGGNRFKDKWGTPDVIGIREPRRSDIIKPPTEIVSAEIKLDASNLITAFGQACSYRLFSHKSYVVVPEDSSEDDIGRLDALSRIFGIGLVVFNPLDPNNPGFSIRSRAAKEEPDMFYVNKYLKLVEDKLFP